MWTKLKEPRGESENLKKTLGETVSTSLIVLEEAASVDLKKREENILGNGRKKNPCYVGTESLTTLACMNRESKRDAVMIRII